MALARLGVALSHRLQQRRAQLERGAQALGHLDPRAVLARGYAIARQADGRIVVSANAVRTDDELDLTFAAGGALVRVQRTRTN